jgi:hypothetical protein
MNAVQRLKTERNRCGNEDSEYGRGRRPEVAPVYLENRRNLGPAFN